MPENDPTATTATALQRGPGGATGQPGGQPTNSNPTMNAAAAVTANTNPTTPTAASDVTPQQFAEIVAENKRLQQMAEAAQAQAVKAAEAIETMRHDAQLQSFAELAKGFIGESAAHVSMLDALPDEPIKLSETEMGPSLRQQYITMQKAHAEQIRTSQLFTQQGRAGRATEGSAEAQLTALAEASMVEAGKTGKPLSFAEAYTGVLSDPRHREIYARYEAERGN